MTFTTHFFSLIAPVLVPYEFLPRSRSRISKCAKISFWSNMKHHRPSPFSPGAKCQSEWSWVHPPRPRKHQTGGHARTRQSATAMCPAGCCHHSKRWTEWSLLLLPRWSPQLTSVKENGELDEVETVPSCISLCLSLTAFWSMYIIMSITYSILMSV